jgi:hypothetical protein
MDDDDDDDGGGGGGGDDHDDEQRSVVGFGQKQKLSISQLKLIVVKDS